MAAYLNVDGLTALSASVRVPNSGPWWADVVMQDDVDISGEVVLGVGELSLTGTVLDGASGSFAEQSRIRIVGGAGAWSSLLGPKHYHNDAEGGVRARTIVDDAAREIGETVGTFSPGAEGVGVDYVRDSGLASRVISDAIGGAVWWVGFDGKTNVGERPAFDVAAELYTVLDSDAAHKIATLSVEDLTSVAIGSTISEGLDEPIVVREMELLADADSIRVLVWGGTTDGHGRAESLLRGIVNAARGDELFGRYRYRVVQMSENRVELQAYSRGRHPDVLPVTMQPGAPGVHGEPAASSIVLVEFLEGSRNLPVVSGFAGKDEPGHAAGRLTFSVSIELLLGGDGATEGVTLGTSHKSWADGHRHGVVGSVGQPPVAIGLLTTAPILSILAASPFTTVPDPAPAPSTKVKTE